MSQSKLEQLIALAHQPSPLRRELLRKLTDMFFSLEPHDQIKVALFDEMLVELASEMEVAVRSELAERIADHAGAPSKLLRELARDPIAVAEPVLARSPALSDDDLLSVVRTEGQGHLRAISRRKRVSEAVSDAIVDCGDDATLSVLLGNDGAELSRAASEIAVDRASVNSELHQAVVDRRSLPIDLLNEMYFVVEARLRKRILEKNSIIDPIALEAALAAGRVRIAARDGALPADYPAADAEVRELIATRKMRAGALATFLRDGQTTKFLVALSQMTSVDFHTGRRILERRDIDALAVICKAADFDRALFLTLTVLILGRGIDARQLTNQYTVLYAELHRDVARRTMRFWQVRRQTGELATVQAARR